MTISVIIPIYKAEQYIRQCLESVIDQEFNAFDIECILIDDVTPDRSMEIANDVISDYHGSNITFVFLRHEENRGPSAARNTGISAASGDYLLFLDSDDVFVENTLKTFFSYHLDYPTVDVIMGNTLWMESRFLSNTPITGKGNSPCLIDDVSLLWKLVLRRQIDRLVVNKLIRRSLIVDNNLYFDENVTLYEDAIWTYNLYSHISSILIVPVITYMYVDNATSLMHTSKLQSRRLVDCLTMVSDFAFKHPLVINGKVLHYAAHRLFVARWLMKAIDEKDNHHIDSNLDHTLFSIRNALLWDAVKHFRPFLALFFLIMFVPLKSLLGLQWFRSKFYLLEKLVYKIS